MWFAVTGVSIFLFDTPLDFHSTIVFVKPTGVVKKWKIGWNIKRFCDRSLRK